MDEFEDESQRKNKNIFDDDVSFDEAKKIILNDIKDDEFDDEDIEVIGWNDVPVQSKPVKPPSQVNLNLDSLGTPSYHKPKTDQAQALPTSKFSHSRSFSLTLGGVRSVGDSWRSPNENSLNRGTSEPSIEEVVDKQYPKKQLTSLEIDKLQSELQYLRRANMLVKRDKFSKIPVEDTIRRMMRGEAYTFELYRSLDDKVSLLDQAIKMHDGNCIIAAVLFLKRTVKPSIFNSQLSQRIVATNHYISYLKNNLDYRELANILSMLGRTEEAAMLQYKIATSPSGGSTKASALKTVFKLHFNGDQQLLSESSLVQEHVDLMERQLAIEHADSQDEASGRIELFRQFPRKRSLFDMPLVTTLYYCCLYHYHLGENCLACPMVIKNFHNLNDKQYLYCAVGAQSRLKNWKTIEQLLTAKGWFGGTKMKAAIGFDKVVEILHKNNAVSDILQKYIACIDDLELRLETAKKVKCHRAVIDVFVATRDRGQLEEYAKQFKHGSQDYFYASDALRNSAIKWK